eukprot:4922089-Pyramimonas_sp.AAC.1
MLASLATGSSSQSNERFDDVSKVTSVTTSRWPVDIRTSQTTVSHIALWQNPTALTPHFSTSSRMQ